jgi:Asp-tRNA(Asn)/Glu-tRNA(Gln) amidotransferase A subunit family amidase
VSALHELSLREAAARVRRREVSSVELTRAALDRIAAADGTVGAFLTVAADAALATAETIDRGIAAGRIRSLGGVPVGIRT